jgi:hypothetical protein
MAPIERLDSLESDVTARAFLYDHPASFREGVEAAFEALRAALASGGATELALAEGAA